MTHRMHTVAFTSVALFTSGLCEAQTCTPPTPGYTPPTVDIRHIVLQGSMFEDSDGPVKDSGFVPTADRETFYQTYRIYNNAISLNSSALRFNSQGGTDAGDELSKLQAFSDMQIAAVFLNQINARISDGLNDGDIIILDLENGYFSPSKWSSYDPVGTDLTAHLDDVGAEFARRVRVAREVLDGDWDGMITWDPSRALTQSMSNCRIGLYGIPIPLWHPVDLTSNPGNDRDAKRNEAFAHVSDLASPNNPFDYAELLTPVVYPRICSTWKPNPLNAGDTWPSGEAWCWLDHSIEYQARKAITDARLIHDSSGSQLGIFPITRFRVNGGPGGGGNCVDDPVTEENPFVEHRTIRRQIETWRDEGIYEYGFWTGPKKFDETNYTTYYAELLDQIAGNNPTPPGGTATPWYCAGDLDEDGDVDAYDNYIACDAIANNNPALDLNQDGSVDSSDQTLWNTIYTTACGNVVDDSCTADDVFWCPGDANGDADVDAADISFIVGNLGQTGVDPGTQGDTNFDGDVTNADISFTTGLLGTSCP
ncbi:MAG: hypothetical protein AAGD00_05830 [Planctomycetota bacterium]